MNFSPTALAAGFIYGVLGVYLIKRGKSEAHVPFVLFGVAMVAYPYFVENITLLWGIGAVLLYGAYRYR